VQKNPFLLAEARATEIRDFATAFPVWSRMIGRDVKAVMQTSRWGSVDFHERIVGIFFHAAPMFSLENHGSGRYAVSTIDCVGRRGPAFDLLATETNAAYRRGWLLTKTGPTVDPSFEYGLD
jgi:hypothetical protein